MRNKLMMGVWRYMLGPPFLWEEQIEKAEHKVKRSTGFMTPEHRSVHHFVVREMVRLGSPIPQKLVAHHSGEQLYAAWAVDTFATPFVQGRLRNEEVSISVVSECALSKRPMYMEIDSDMNCTCEDLDCSPVIFVPDVNFRALKDPSIIDAFWKESVFFWSEEHAREYRRQTHRVRCGYFTAKQIAYLNRRIQSALFGW